MQIVVVLPFGSKNSETLNFGCNLYPQPIFVTSRSRPAFGRPRISKSYCKVGITPWGYQPPGLPGGARQSLCNMDFLITTITMLISLFTQPKLCGPRHAVGSKQSEVRGRTKRYWSIHSLHYLPRLGVPRQGVPGQNISYPLSEAAYGLKLVFSLFEYATMPLYIVCSALYNIKVSSLG